MRTVLLLAGTAEARALADAFEFPGIRLVASLAGATSAPAPYLCETRAGGFGGARGLREWLDRERAVAVVDATHPYATGISRNAAMACAATKIPLVTLIRPPWAPMPGWSEFATLDQAVAALPPQARVLATTGSKHVAAFLDRNDMTVFLRSVEPISDMPEHVVPVTAHRPPALGGEIAFMRSNRITHLLTRNSGGDSRARIDAAVTLGLPVHVIERPPQPVANVVHSVADAIRRLDMMLRD